MLKAYCVNVDMLSADGEEFVMLPSVEGGSIDGNHSDEVLQYSAKSAVISAVRGKKLNRTNDSTNFMYSDKVTKYCSIVRKVLSLVLFGSNIPHYSTNVLCHYDGGRYVGFHCTTLLARRRVKLDDLNQEFPNDTSDADLRFVDGVSW